MADKMTTRMPSFTLQPHHLAFSHGIARMQGSLSDTDNSSFYISFVCVGGGGGGGVGGGGGYGLFKIISLISSRLVTWAHIVLIDSQLEALYVKDLKSNKNKNRSQWIERNRRRYIYHMTVKLFSEITHVIKII